MKFGPNTLKYPTWDGGLGVSVLKELESDVHRPAWGGGGKNWLREKRKELRVYRAQPKATELLTPSLTTTLLGTRWNGKDRRAWIWVQGNGPGLNRRPIHLACGARAIRLNPFSPRVLQGSGIVLSVPSETFNSSLPKVLTSGARR